MTYYPTDLTNLLTWLRTQRTELKAKFAQLGLTQDEADAEVLLIDARIENIEQVQAQQDTLATAVATRDTALETFGKNYRTKVQRWKRTTTYTPDLGVAFKWDAPAPTPPNPDTAAPRISNTHLSPGLVTIDWVRGVFDGVEVEASYDNQTWTKLDFDTRSPFEDTRPNQVPGQPEARYYRLRYRLKGKAFGQYSDVATVLVG